jgi:hypothetical protein
MGWGLTSITHAQNGGKFLKQTLHIFRYRIKELVAWNKNRSSAACKTLGKNDLAAAGAIASQANSTWLVSVATMILNFLKKTC